MGNRPKSSVRRNHEQTLRRLRQNDARRIEVAFTAQQVDAPGREPGIRWVAELVDATGTCTVPKCICYLTDYSPVMGMILDYLIVPFPDDRRLGYGTRMVEECRKRWPGLELTEGCTPEGVKFCEAIPDSEPVEARFEGNGRFEGDDTEARFEALAQSVEDRYPGLRAAFEENKSDEDRQYRPGDDGARP